MISVSVESVGDGEAIIRLKGLTGLPPATTFRIEPIDDGAVGDVTPGWPRGDLEPVAARVGADGVELVIGQDVVDAPLLLPGTPVVLTVPGAGVRQELRWPKLTVPTQRRRAAAILTSEQRAAEMAARAEQQRAELARIRAARIAAEKEQEEAALALLDARRMAPSDGVAGAPPRLRDALDAGTTSASSDAAGNAPAPSSRGGNGVAAASAAAAAAGMAAGSLSMGRAARGPGVQAGPPPIPATGVSSPAADTPGVGGSPERPPPLPAGVEVSGKADDVEPVDPRSAEEVLARQMATRAQPHGSGSGSRLPLAFATGFLVAGALAALTTFWPDRQESRGVTEDLVAELRSESAGLRQRLAAEMDARRAASEAAGRAEALAEEVRQLQKRLAGADAAESELARLGAELAASTQRLTALGEAKQSAESTAETLRQRLDEVEVARRQAEGEAQRLAKELEQVRTAAGEAASRRQARDGVRTEGGAPQTPTAAAASSIGPGGASAGPSGAASGGADGAITLSVRGSEFEISGKLESFDGRTFVIVAPNVGSMSFPADRVECRGTGCPR